MKGVLLWNYKSFEHRDLGSEPNPPLGTKINKYDPYHYGTRDPGPERFLLIKIEISIYCVTNPLLPSRKLPQEIFSRGGGCDRRTEPSWRTVLDRLMKPVSVIRSNEDKRRSKRKTKVHFPSPSVPSSRRHRFFLYVTGVKVTNSKRGSSIYDRYFCIDSLFFRRSGFSDSNRLCPMWVHGQSFISVSYDVLYSSAPPISSSSFCSVKE